MNIELKLLSETERELSSIESDKEREKIYRLISITGNEFRPNIHDYTKEIDNYKAAKTYVGWLGKRLGKLTEIIYAKDTKTDEVIGFLSVVFKIGEERAKEFYGNYKDIFESPQSIVGNAQLTLLYVHSNHRKKKIATDLIKIMERLLKGRGSKKVLARTMKESEEAQMFYDKIRYKNIGEKDPDKPYRTQYGYIEGTIWRAKNLQR